MNHTEYMNLKRGDAVFKSKGNSTRTGKVGGFVKHTRKYFGAPKVMIIWDDNGKYSCIEHTKIHHK